MIHHPRLPVLVTALCAVVLAAAAVAADADPRAAEIKRRLERLNLKVTDVSVAPAKGPAAAVWAAGTVATYAQPSWDKVIDQALTVWNVMFTVLKGEPPATVLSSAQDWKTYRLFVGITMARITAFDAGVRTAQTDADRDNLFKDLYAGIIFRVVDLQQQKLVNSNGFVKTHFLK